MTHLLFFIPIFVIIAIATNIFTIYKIISFEGQANNKLTYYLVIAIISINVWIIMTYLQLEFWQIDSNIMMFAITAFISNLGTIVGIIFLGSFINLLIEPELNKYRIRFLLSALAFTIGVYIIHVYAGVMKDFGLANFTLTIANIMNFIIFSIVFYYALSDLQVLLSENLNEQQRSQVNYFRYSLIVLLIGVLPVVILATFFGQGLIAYSYIFLTIALFIFARSYIEDPRIAFILPQKTYLALVVNSYGTLRYRKSFTGVDDDTSSVLISGALNAINSLMSEFYNSQVNPKLIKFEDRMILFNWTEYYFLAVFTDQDSQLIRSAMNLTLERINAKYGDDLRYAMTEEAEYLNLDDVFSETFYFIYN